jgi:glycerol uptake facilitator-like aquaporin
VNARELVHDLIEFAEFLGAEVLVVLGEALGCAETRE